MGFARVEQNFNAKLNPKVITYRYFFFDNSYDLTKMQEAALIFKGKYSFKRFLNSEYDKSKTNAVVEILETQIHIFKNCSTFNPVGYYELKSDGFYANQVI